MGRWAEVYFTAAPERREEAVIELLRQLEAENPSRALAASTPDTAQIRQAEESIRALESAHQEDLEKQSRNCEQCGHVNPPGHQFCGMCGVLLRNARANGASGAVAYPQT